MSARHVLSRLDRSTSVRRIVATIPLIAVALGLQAAWLAAGFAVWNVEVERIQMAADAAALAGAAAFAVARERPAEDHARAVAQDYAALNNPGRHPQRVVVETGTWDAAARAFAPASGCDAAVRVTVRRTGLLGTVAPVLYGDVLGWSGSPGESTAVAVMGAARVSGGCPVLLRTPRLVR